MIDTRLDPSHQPFLSIVIPAFNEAKRLGPTLEKVEAFRKNQSYSTEVILVNDHSSDATLSVMESFVKTCPGYYIINNRVNFGKGFSVQQGMLTARGQYRLFSDADLSTPIEEVNKLLPFVNPAMDPAFPVNKKLDIVIGSRRVKGAQIEVRQPIHREAAGRMFSYLVRLLVVRGFLDTQCGFKLFNARAATDVFRCVTIPGFGFDVELLFIAKRKGYTVMEAPVVWVDSPESTVRLGRDATQMFMDLLLIRWRNFWGAYA